MDKFERIDGLMRLLRQPQYSPYSLNHQVLLIYAGTRGYMDDVETEDVERWKSEFLRYMDTTHSSVGDSINSSFRLQDDAEATLKQAVADFNATWS